MCIFELTAILDQHKITNRVSNGRVMALDKKQLWVDVTDWSRLQMVKWLKA